MYTAPQKRFRAKKESILFDEIEKAAAFNPHTRRIFLADGDAMVLSTRRLLAIMSKIKKCFPQINRISSYCLPRNLKSKSVTELKELQDAGLALVYVGALVLSFPMGKERFLQHFPSSFELLDQAALFQ